MRYQTELMRSILTSETAQKMIDFVSPIYGDSYVGLWLFQVIGAALDDACDIVERLRYEMNASTADILLAHWEQQYGLQENSGLTTEQRRARIVAKKRSRGSCNPARLAEAVSVALGGVKVDIQERVDQNTFLVNIREYVPSLVPAVAVIERMKPAHLVYQIRVAEQYVAETDIKIAVAMTYAERYKVEVLQ